MKSFVLALVLGLVAMCANTADAGCHHGRHVVRHRSVSRCCGVRHHHVVRTRSCGTSCGSACGTACANGVCR